MNNSVNQSMTPTAQRKCFEQHYFGLCMGAWTLQSKIEFIGQRDHRVCRYCGGEKPEVTFKERAHALPELIGNRWLFALDECDVCNDFFSVALEDHLAKYLGVRRTFSQIRGKTGVPSYKDKDGKSRIDVYNTGIEIVHPRNSTLIERDRPGE
jgi:HNH endonuclease